MARKIVLTSGKGGVGKTTICANLGVALARQNKRVLLVDVDIGLNNLDVVMGVENKVVFDIVDVIEGKCRAKQALIQHFDYANLYIMPSAHSYNVSMVTAENVKMVIDKLDMFFDFILLDCPAGIDEPFKRAVISAGEAIVVVTPHLSSLRDAGKVLSEIKKLNISEVNLIVNRVRGDLVVSNDVIDCQKISDLLGCDLLGVIPEDDNISLLLGVGKTVDKDCESYLPFDLIAKNVLEGQSILYDCSEKYRGLFGFVKRLIKRKI